MISHRDTEDTERLLSLCPLCLCGYHEEQRP